ncbi:MAG: DUF2271 domain-containing protein [Bacteroidales bacterium]|nr:DUF2271 domain-containing protein [Bacteroidales bacterium]
MKLKALLFSLFLFAATTLSFSQVLTFKVQTAKYSTNTRILAIWITNSNNTFVKTIYASSNHKYSADLVKWVASSAKNITDATTGASSAHPAIPATYSWNCTNVSKAVVPDGNYFVNVEFTEEPLATASKYTQCPFTIGQASTGSIADATYFKGVSYSTTISAQTPINEANADLVYDIYYQPSAKILSVKYDAQMHSGVTATIFDLKGYKVSEQKMADGSSSIVLNNLSKGVYVVKFNDNKGLIETKRFVAR